MLLRVVFYNALSWSEGKGGSTSLQLQEPEVRNVENCLGTRNIQSKLPAAKKAYIQLKTACRQIIMKDLHEMGFTDTFLMKKAWKIAKTCEISKFFIEKLPAGLTFHKTAWAHCAHVPMDSADLFILPQNLTGIFSMCP